MSASSKCDLGLCDCPEHRPQLRHEANPSLVRALAENYPKWMKDLKLTVGRAEIVDELAERRAKNREIAECKRLAAMTGQRFNEKARDVRAMTAAELSWTTYALRRLAILEGRQGPFYIDGI